jgi:hypothetical protein
MMSNRGAEQVEGIWGDLACTRCRYNLRGLVGPVVTCPECGTRYDVADLIMLRWRGTRLNAPGVSRIAWPMAWLYAGSLMAVFATAVSLPLWEFLWIIVLVGWPCLLWNLRDMMPRGRAVLLSLLAHGLVVGYAACAAAVPLLLLLCVTFEGSDSLVVFLVGLLMIAAMWLLCRRGEWFIARCCVRQYLIDDGRFATMRP